MSKGDISPRQHFFIASLPRSRTAWLANYLTYGDSFCYHDAFARHRGVPQLAEAFHQLPHARVGNSDPANLYFWQELHATYPEAQWVVVRRDFEQVYQSTKRALGIKDGHPMSRGPLWEASIMLDKLCATLHPYVVEFDQLDEQAPAIASYLGVDAGGEERLTLLKNLQVQIEPNLLRRLVAALQQEAA